MSGRRSSATASRAGVRPAPWSRARARARPAPGRRATTARPRRSPRPSVVGLVLAVLALLLTPALAAAHGGILLASAVAGPYRTQVTAAPLTERGRPPAIDVTVYLSTVDSNTPISDATVRTTVEADGRTVTPSVREIAGGYEAIVPVKNAFTVGKQRIHVQISGPRGTGQLTIDPTDASGGGPPVALIVGTVVVLAALLVLVVRVRRGRARELDAEAPATGS